MSDLIPAGQAPSLRAPARVALPEDVPGIEALFLFASEAELRVSSLRMHIEERVVNARGEDVITHEIQLRHPGQARVATKRSSEPLTRDYDVWLSDGESVRTYEASNRIASVRPRRKAVAGVNDPGLPPYARQREPLTPLPSGSLADAFIHPHGLFRYVLVTGPLSVVGTQPIAGREAIVVRAQHPRTAKVLVDRPDRSVDVGIGRESGFLLLLIERIGDTVTRHAEVTQLDLDPQLFDSAFELKLPADVRMLY